MSTITIGAFTTSRLTAQPFGYEGEARFGRTARTFRISGLLTPSEWQTLISEYNSWRSTRIQDPDTLVSKVVGTTIAFSTGVSINNLSVTNLACWFAQAPQGDQAGKYVSATVVLVDAAEALAVLLREQDAQNEVDCTKIAADLQKRKDETDCEIAALQTGLADDFALQDLTKAEIEATARAGAYSGNTALVEGVQAGELQVAAVEAEAKATSYAADTASIEAIKGAEIDVELLELDAYVQAVTTGTRLDDLRAARSLQSLYDKYIGEDLPDLGTVTLGSVTIKLLKPMTTYSDGPQLALTATGNSYVTGALTAHETRQIEGIITSGSYDSLLSWYSSTINAVPGVGTWFPTSSPSATAEPFLISGVKSTRYTVSIEVKKVR